MQYIARAILLKYNMKGIRLPINDEESRSMKKNNLFSFSAVAVLLIDALVISGPMNARTAISSAYAEETASHDILSAAEAAAQSLQMAEELESEGIVLLRNENGALPLAAGAGETYVSNINDVIAEYGSAVPAAFLQNAVIVLVDEP